MGITELKVMLASDIDSRLEKGYNRLDNWEDYLKSLPLVEDAIWHSSEPAHTIIKFKSEAHKEWFLLKWS